MASASIQKIRTIRKIENSNNLSAALVQGWQVVFNHVQNDYKVGDYIIYVEIDSQCPQVPEFEFLRDRNFRVKTIRIRGEISQGLILPISTLLNFSPNEYNNLWYMINAGTDVTNLDCSSALGITHYEKPISSNMGEMNPAGDFPYFLNKTDELMLQSHPSLLGEIQGLPYYISRKDDGTSMSVWRYNEEFGVASRKVSLKESENIYWMMVQKYHLQNLINNLYLQGEIVGPGIQKNRLGLKELEFHVFTVGAIYNKRFGYNQHSMLKSFSEIQTVDTIETGEKFEYDLNELIEIAGKTKYPNGAAAEGIVVRPITPVWSPEIGDWLSFKVLNNNYLLKNGE